MFIQKIDAFSREKVNRNNYQLCTYKWLLFYGPKILSIKCKQSNYLQWVPAQVFDKCFSFSFLVVECKLSSWSEWSGCDRKCGKGVQSRSRVIVQHPSAGRPPCEPLEQKRGCMGTRCSKRDRKYKNPIRGKQWTNIRVHM